MLQITVTHPLFIAAIGTCVAAIIWAARRKS
jgi:hypothetical protein